VAAPQSVPRPDWSRLPIEGAVGIEGKVLLRGSTVSIAMLRFVENAGFPGHSAPFDVDVVCLEGAGFVLVGEETFPLSAGQSVRWPADAMHRLWTESTGMTTLMVEHGSWDASDAEPAAQ
jgi:quercetin dioxygenase-like cupin family protein